jgi:NDP-sugar pyrophosphorylase family protein
MLPAKAIQHPHSAPTLLHDPQVITVSEECDTADALRAATPHLGPHTDGVVVYSGDLICDAPLGAMIVTHQLSGALATVLVGARRVSPTAETKPGKAPKVGCFDG